MKKNYLNQPIKEKSFFSMIFMITLFAILSCELRSQIVTYSFTPCGASGVSGPSQLQATNTYSPTNLNGMVTVSLGIQSWTVPVSGPYRIAAYGAQGGGSAGFANTGSVGGLAAAMVGDYTLTSGQILKILVGQMGGSSAYGGGGGGGSYVVDISNNPMMIGGGGGGGNGYVGYTRGVFQGGCGLITTSGGNSNQTTGNYGAAAPGTGGGAIAMGGSQGYGGGGALGGGGGGLLNNGGQGSNANMGLGFIQGGTGGTGNGTNSPPNHGGFGGGGGGVTSSGYGGGGGGYSGGGSGSWDGTTHGNGGGGGSFNGGANQTNTACINSGDGKVIITRLCDISLSISSNPICSGTSVTLTTNAISNYSWSNGNTTTNSIVVTPTANITYSVSGTSTSNCISSAAVNVTVSGGLPTMSVNTSTNYVCLGRSVTLTATGALTYTWSSNVINGVSFIPLSGTNNYTVTGGNGCGTSTAVTTVTVGPLLVNTASSSSVACSGITTTLTASSAVNGFTWQPTPAPIFNSVAVVGPTVSTIFTVTASDGTCIGTATIGLQVNPLPTPTIVSTATQVCQNSSVTLTASGGLTYLWNPGGQTTSVITVNVPSPTLFSVTATNSFGCIGIANQIVVTSAAPILNLSSSINYVCPGDPVELTAGGADTYLWSNNATGNTTTVNPTSLTVYSVTGSNTVPCSSTMAITIDVLNPNVTVSGNTAVCLGSPANLTGNGADSYQWSNNTSGQTTVYTPTATGIFSVSASTSSNGLTCSKDVTFALTVNPLPTVTVNASRNPICKGETSTISGGGASTYSWLNGPSTASFVSTGSLVTQTLYSVTGTDANGCKKSTSIQLTVNACTGIESYDKNSSGIVVYPNPSHGEFTIESGMPIKLNLVNNLGQVLRSISLNESNNFKSKLTDIAIGIYFITDEKQSVNLKLISQ